MPSRALFLSSLAVVFAGCFYPVPSVDRVAGAGPPGRNGADGKDGEQGATGSTGPKGDPGEIGGAGETGASGATGATGAHGGIGGATGSSGDLSLEPHGLVLRRAPWRGDERYELIWSKVDGAAFYRVEITIDGLRRHEVVSDTALEIPLAPNTGEWSFRVVPIDFDGAEGKASDPFAFDTALRFFFLSYGDPVRDLQVLSTSAQPFDTQASLWNDPTNRADRAYGSPDGRSLAFLTWTATSTELRIADLAAGTSRVLRSVTGGSWLLPAWSPDRRFIAGQHFSYSKPGRQTIEVMDVSSGTMVFDLPDSPATIFLGALSWSSDGRFLACSGPDGITVVDMTTRTTRIVKPGAIAVAPLRWNPRYPVLAATTPTSIVFYDADADSAVEHPGRVAGAAAWSPDGTRALYLTYELTEEPKLHLTTLAGTTDTVLFAPGARHGIGQNVRWARDSRAVYLIHAESGPAPVMRSIVRVSITGGAETIFTSKGGALGLYGSSMHRYLAMTRTGATGLELVFLDQLSGELTVVFSATKATTSFGGGEWSWDGSRFGATLRGGLDSPSGETSAAVLLFSPDAPALPLPTPLPKNDDAYDALGWLGLP